MTIPNELVEHLKVQCVYFYFINRLIQLLFFQSSTEAAGYKSGEISFRTWRRRETG